MPYWESAYLDPATEAERREEALWRAAERRTVRSDRRAEAVRALLAHERAYGNAPSERQREAALFTLDNEIDNDNSLSPEEKAARKAQLRQNNPEAVSWLLGAAARQMEAAGLPGMPAPGQTAQAKPAPQDTPQSDLERRWATFERH